MQNKFEIPFNGIVNANSQQKEKIKENWIDESDEFAKRDEAGYAGFEQPLTQEKKSEMETLQNYANEIALRYGAAEKLAPKVVILKPGGVFKVTDGEFKNGFCSPYRRRIMIDDASSKIDFATTLAHELFHLAGYTTLRFSKEDDDAVLYRTGISLFSKDRSSVYFHEIEEALMAEAAQILFDQYLRHDPLYAEEIKKTDFVKGWLHRLYDMGNVPLETQNEIMDSIYSFPDVDDLIDRLNGDDVEDYKFGFLHGYIGAMLEKDDVILRERNEERKKFYSLVDKILENSNGEYASRQEVVDVFMKAHFSGRLLPLARMLEKSIAKGSFRDVANDFAEHFSAKSESYEDFNDEPMDELSEKRRKEQKEMQFRQKQRIEKLEGMEKNGTLFVKE